MKSRLERLWTDMNAMPGPVWVFGAWSIARFVSWLVKTAPGQVYAVGQGGWITIGITLLILAGYLLPLVAVWTLIRRKTYALSLAMWYAGLKVAASFVVLIAPLFRKPDPAFEGLDFPYPAAWPLMVIGIGVWFAFLYYLERGETLGHLFPKQTRRRVPWWAVVPMIGLVAAMNL